MLNENEKTEQEVVIEQETTSQLVEELETEVDELETEEDEDFDKLELEDQELEIDPQEVMELLNELFNNIEKDKNKQMKFENKLIKNGFKIKHFQDESGYWFSKKVKFPIFGKIKVLVEPDNKLMYFEFKTKEDYMDIKLKVKSWKKCKKILKKYKLL